MGGLIWEFIFLLWARRAVACIAGGSFRVSLIFGSSALDLDLCIFVVNVFGNMFLQTCFSILSLGSRSLGLCCGVVFINVVYVRMSFCILRFGSRTLDMLCGSCCVNVLFLFVFGDRELWMSIFVFHLWI